MINLFPSIINYICIANQLSLSFDMKIVAGILSYPGIIIILPRNTFLEMLKSILDRQLEIIDNAELY